MMTVSGELGTWATWPTGRKLTSCQFLGKILPGAMETSWLWELVGQASTTTALAGPSPWWSAAGWPSSTTGPARQSGTLTVVVPDQLRDSVVADASSLLAPAS